MNDSKPSVRFDFFCWIDCFHLFPSISELIHCNQSYSPLQLQFMSNHLDMKTGWNHERLTYNFLFYRFCLVSFSIYVFFAVLLFLSIFTYLHSLCSLFLSNFKYFRLNIFIIILIIIMIQYVFVVVSVVVVAIKVFFLQMKRKFYLGSRYQGPKLRPWRAHFKVVCVRVKHYRYVAFYIFNSLCLIIPVVIWLIAMITKIGRISAEIYHTHQCPREKH